MLQLLFLASVNIVSIKSILTGFQYRYCFYVGTFVETICLLIFNAFADKTSSFALIKNESRPPFASTVLKAEVATLNLNDLPNISELRVTLLKLGRNLLFVLFFAWLTLLPT